MFVRNRFTLLVLLLPTAQACAYASTDGFIEDLDGSGDGAGPSASGGNTSVGNPPTGGSSSSGGAAAEGSSTGGKSTGGQSSGSGSGSGGASSGPGPGPFPFPGPGPGAGSGGSSGSGGSAGNSCTMVTCGSGTYPKPTGNVCFSFTTTQFGGWQASNTAGCTLTFDGKVTPPPGVNPTTAGAHELEFAGCTSSDIGWSCWN